jgi:hypothetical protein
MNKKNMLVAAAAAALIVGTTGAIAQQERGGRAGPASGLHENTGPAAGHSRGAAPQGGVGINRNGSPEQRSERTGSARSGRMGQIQHTGQAPRNDRSKFSDERAKGSLGDPEHQRGRFTEQQRGRETERGRPTEERGRRVLERDRVTTGRERDIPDRAFGGERSTTGQGAAPLRGAVNLSPEQRTRLHGVFVGERNAPRLDDVDFDLAVGRPVPRSVHFVPVPQAVFDIEPAWRGYDYFMVGDQIVIVDPRSMEIVAILEA